MIDQLTYYTDVCNDAENMEHAQPLDHFWDLLDDENLLPEDCTEEDLDQVFENPDAVSDELFYSFYYYSKIVLSQVPDIKFLKRPLGYFEEKPTSGVVCGQGVDKLPQRSRPSVNQKPSEVLWTDHF